MAARTGSDLMATAPSLVHLLRAVRNCTPQVRDQLTAGTLANPRLTLESAAGYGFPFSEAEFTAVVRSWVKLDGFPHTTSQRVFAAHSDTRIATVARVYQSQSRPGVYLVEVLCPYAQVHLWRPRGHQLHTHGVPKGRTPGLDGSLGMRVPHCEGNTRGQDVLPNYELILPRRLRDVMT